MPEKKREPFVKDEEARELDRLFALREMRRFIRLQEQGAVIYKEKWHTVPEKKPASKFRKALSHSCGVAAAVCWVLCLGAVGALERGRADLLTGVLLMLGCAILAVLLGVLACLLGGETR